MVGLRPSKTISRLKEHRLLIILVFPRIALNSCIKFQVHNTNDLVSTFNLQGLIGDGCKPPELNYRVVMVHEPIIDDHEKSTVDNKRYDFSGVSDIFMATPLWGQVCEELINKIENIANAEARYDDADTELCSRIFNEMNNHIKYSNQP